MKVTRWLLIGCSTLTLLSAIGFGVQGGFGAGHGDFDLLIYLAGMPWTALPWPSIIMQADVIWLIVLPFVLNVTSIAIILAVVRLFTKRRDAQGKAHKPTRVA